MSGTQSSLERVYRSTTMPQSTSPAGPLASIKRLLSLGGPSNENLDPLIDTEACNIPVISRQGTLLNAGTHSDTAIAINMPTSIAEEVALLGTMPSDSMDDIELKNIQLQFPTSLRLSGDGDCTEFRVHTDRGDILVAVNGDRRKPAILTYHDLGLNYVSNFQAFFNFVDMKALLDSFCVYHLNAPGQEEGAPNLPNDYIYPTMDDLACQINYVLSYFNLKSFVGFGVGAGANILARFALTNPQRVEALTLINCASSTAGWIEWGYQKINSRHLRMRGMTQGPLDYLMWHHFGRCGEERNHDLVEVYRLYFTRSVNPANLSMFIDSYVRRTDLNINRMGETIMTAVLNITGAHSPHVEDTVYLNSRLNPVNATWLKISDCGMVLEEEPEKLAEAFRLFLQGEGYVAPLSPTKIVEYRRMSIEEPLFRRISLQPSPPTMRITENPFSQALIF